MQNNPIDDASRRWAAVQAVFTGNSHIRSGAPCQDKTFVLLENGVFAAALADGAGSADKSHFGAETVVRAACELLCRKFDDYFNGSPLEAKKDLIGYALSCLREEASVRRCALRDLASTLLAVAVSGDRYLLFHLGDGVVGYVKNGEMRVATPPLNGEFVNVTCFVTSSGAVRDMQTRGGTDRDIQGFVLMSDGCEAGLYGKQQNVLAPVLGGLLARLSVTSGEYMRPGLEKSIEVVAQKTSDDCGLILAARREQGYNTLPPEEQAAFFEITDSASAETAVRRYTAVLDALDVPKTREELDAALVEGDIGALDEDWLRPLLELRYVEEDGAGLLRRLVEPCPKPDAKEEQHE